ncbi:hypothetical protein VN97_g13026, partial [Penicillium thymicola]
ARVIRINRSLDNSINMLNRDLKPNQTSKVKRLKGTQQEPRCAMWTRSGVEKEKEEKEEVGGGGGYLYLHLTITCSGTCFVTYQRIIDCFFVDRVLLCLIG